MRLVTMNQNSPRGVPTCRGRGTTPRGGVRDLDGVADIELFRGFSRYTQGLRGDAMDLCSAGDKIDLNF